jgi:hypothetical protein
LNEFIRLDSYDWIHRTTGSTLSKNGWFSVTDIYGIPVKYFRDYGRMVDNRGGQWVDVSEPHIDAYIPLTAGKYYIEYSEPATVLWW